MSASTARRTVMTCVSAVHTDARHISTRPLGTTRQTAATIRAESSRPPSRPDLHRPHPTGSGQDSTARTGRSVTMKAKIQLASRCGLKMKAGGQPMVAIPGGELWSHPRHGIVRIDAAQMIDARYGRRVSTRKVSRLAASIGLARWTAAGMSGSFGAALAQIAGR